MNDKSIKDMPTVLVNALEVPKIKELEKINLSIKSDTETCSYGIIFLN